METFKYISCVVCLGMFLACSNEEPVINEPPVVTPNEKPAEAKDIMLTVRPTLDAMKTRAIVEAFQVGHTMGVFTTDNGGGAVSSNVSFAYDGNEWKAGGNAPVKGDMNVTAYFPYSASVTDCREIPVDLTRQEDCLYGTARVTKLVPTAALTMKHALSLVRIKVMKDEYMGQGKVENVTIYDSELNGEYLGWHSRNLRLVNCHITGEQPLCYAQDLVLENCTFGPDCDRAFEYSTVKADIRGAITNIKNPTSGHIVADSIGSITLDENIKAPADCVIEERGGSHAV